MYKVILLLSLLLLGIFSARAAPIVNQTGNLLNNGSLDLGSFNPITGHSVSSAGSSWSQWANSGTPLTTELITETEMITSYGTGIQDGSSALKIVAGGAGDGGYTMNSWNTGWSSAGTAPSFTFSGWVYVVSGGMYFAVGSNSTGYFTQATTKIGEWEFISITATSGSINELLLYSTSASTFIVDSIWLNKGITSSHPSQTPVPEPTSLLLFLFSIILSKFFIKN